MINAVAAFALAKQFIPTEFSVSMNSMLAKCQNKFNYCNHDECNELL
jgi:hypothetical protein